MMLTTRPIRIHDQTQNIRPEFIRLPKPGEHDPWTGLSRSTLNMLALPCPENNFRPPVRSCTLRRRGTMRGVRLIDFQSLLDHLNSKIEPAHIGENDDMLRAQLTNRETTSVQKLELDQSLRVIISVRVEKEAVTGADDTKVCS